MNAPSSTGQTVLITGAAGFIGSHLAQRLLNRGDRVVGIDSFSDFYDPAIKRATAAELAQSDRFSMVEADIRDRDAVLSAVADARPSVIYHLAAKAGVRPSIADPAAYAAVNVGGTVSLLDAAVASSVERFIFASSSSVYGNNTKVPFAETDPVDEPISPYAATKRAGELICHTYHHLHGLPIACLRFFTVFGPRQRPDLAIARFLKLIDAGKPIPMFGDGSTSRDYTFIDDIIDGVVASAQRIDQHGYRIWNLGGNQPVSLRQMIDTVAQVVGKPAKIDRQPMQPGDVNRTYADLTRSADELGYAPQTPLAAGVERQWQSND